MRLFYDNVRTPRLCPLMYGDCGALRDARLIFAKMQKRDVFSWNFMIKACTRLGLGEEALQLFANMQREAMMPDQFILASALSACASEATIAEGKRLHARVAGRASGSDAVLGTALINMYGKCGWLDDARDMFNKITQRDVVSWTAMIEAYCKDGLGKEALNLYVQMQREGVMPDRFIMVSILSACASQSSLTEGKEMHAHIKSSGFESDIVVGNALIHMYGKCSNVEEARMVFERMPKKDVISWNAMIGVFTQNEQGKNALKLFEQMKQIGVQPDKVTFVSVFDSCASLGAITRAKEIHHGIMGSEFATDVVVGTAAVSMYGKCGCLDDALKTFDKMPVKDLVLWNALIAAYAQNGQSKDALQIFHQMQSEGVPPDEVTYISVLSACSHAGFMDEGWRYFGSMTRKYGIVPIADHYNCLIDLLGRAGRLNEADKLISRMSVQPTAVSWLTLLGACRNQVDVEQGECVAKHLFELDPQNVAPYIILSTIYAAVGRDHDAAKVINLMRAKGLKKPLGYSTIEVKGIINEFWTDDQSHPLKEKIYGELETLSRLMVEAGYSFRVNLMMSNLEGEEDKVCVHSERLAIAFGLISTAPKTRLFVTKNLRMCSDCHSAAKFVSKIAFREIVVRDANRFHYMKDGLCSCADYW